jgi:hypothetical protein
LTPAAGLGCHLLLCCGLLGGGFIGGFYLRGCLCFLRGSLLRFRWNEGAFGLGQGIDLALAWDRYVSGKDKTKSKAGELVVCQFVNGRKQNLFCALIVVLILGGEVFGDIVGKGVGIKVDEGAKKNPQLGYAKHRWGILKDAVELGIARLLQLFLAGAFCFPFLLSLLIFQSAFLGSALLFLLVLLSLLFVVAFPLLGLCFRFGFSRGCHCWGGVGGLFCGCAWVVYGAVVVGAYGNGGK